MRRPGTPSADVPATMTFIVIRTEWTDAASGAAVVTEQFNLIARKRK